MPQFCAGLKARVVKHLVGALAVNGSQLAEATDN
jgi:hypothetical protein